MTCLRLVLVLMCFLYLPRANSNPTMFSEEENAWILSQSKLPGNGLKPASKKDLISIETDLSVKFPEDFKEFYINYSHLIFESVYELPLATANKPQETELHKIIISGWNAEIEKKYIPFLNWNGNYFLLDNDEGVRYWDHMQKAISPNHTDQWKSFKEFAMKVLISDEEEN